MSNVKCPLCMSNADFNYIEDKLAEMKKEEKKLVIEMMRTVLVSDMDNSSKLHELECIVCYVERFRSLYFEQLT